MSTVTLNSKAYPWANWTPTGLSRFVNAGSTVVGNSSLTFGSKVLKGTVDGSVVLAVPVLVAADSTCGCAGEVKFTNYTTVRRQVSPLSTLAERTDELARLRGLVLTTQFENWSLYDTLPV